MESKSIIKGEVTKVESSLIHRVFEERISKFDVFAAARDEKTKRTFYELNQNANKIARTILETLGGSAKSNVNGDLVIIVSMKQSIDLLETMLAILKIGAAYLSINGNSPREVISEIKPILVIHDGSNPQQLSQSITINHEDLKREAENQSSENLENDLMLSKAEAKSAAFILLSPKCIRFSHSNVINLIEWQLKAFPFCPTETSTLLKSEATSSDHLIEIWSSLIAGHTLIVVPRETVDDVKRFVDLLEENRIHRVSGEPEFLQNILSHVKLEEKSLKEPKILLSNLKLWMSRGENLSHDLAKSFFDYFHCGSHWLINSYGVPGSPVVTTQLIRSKEEFENFECIPIGLPMHNTIVYILDQDLKPVPESEVGDIYISGASVGRSESDIKNPFEDDEPYQRILKTGDLGFVRQGILFFQGKQEQKEIEDVISEIEECINNLDYVEKLAILVHHLRMSDQSIIAFVSTKVTKLPSEIEQDLSTQLKQIPQIEIIEGFSLLSDGKVDRQKLLKMFEENVAQRMK